MNSLIATRWGERSLIQHEELRSAIVEHLSRMNTWTHALTVTFRPSLLGSNCSDEAWMSKAVEHFLRRLNRACFGAQARRRGKQIGVYAVVAYDPMEENPHGHLTLAMPPGMSDREFTRLIRRVLPRVRAFNIVHDIKPYETEGWFHYCLKHSDYEPDWNLCRPLVA